MIKLILMTAIMALAAGTLWAQTTLTLSDDSLTTATGAYQSAVHAYPYKWDVTKGDVTIEGLIDLGGIQAYVNTWDPDLGDPDDFFGLWGQIGLSKAPVFNSSDGVWFVTVEWLGGGDDSLTEIREILHMQEEPGTQPMPKLYTEPRTIAGGDGDDTLTFELQIHSTGATTGWAKLWIHGVLIEGDMWSVFDPDSLDFTGEDLSNAHVLVGVMNGNNTNNPAHTFYWSNLTITGYPASYSEVWVDSAWVGTAPGTEVEPGKYFGFNAFAEIQDGIDAVAVGGTVYVAAGKYVENVQINKSVALIGAVGAEITPGSGVGVDISADNVTVQGFAIHGCAQGILVWLDKPEYDANFGYSNLHLLDNTIYDISNDAWGFGIYIGTESERYNPSHGLYDPSLTDLLDFTGLLVHGNEIYNTSGASIVLQSMRSYDSNLLLVSENNIHDNAMSAIWIDGAWDIEVSGNELTGNSNGVFFSNYGDGYYETIPDNAFDPKNILVVENIILSNSSVGLNIWDGYPGQLHFNYNSIVGNGTGVDNHLSPLTDASGNWWGTNTPSGVAAQVSGNVDYTPWLDVGTDTEPSTPGFQGDFSVLDVDDDSPQTGATGRIQEGVDLVTGSTVNVMAGTYEAQVVIGKELTLVGAGKDVTVIQSPTTLTEYFTTSADNYPIVYIHDEDVTVQDFTIDGLGRGNANHRFVGIGFWNAGGSVTNVDLTGVRDTPFSGAQHGVAIYAYNNTGGPYTIDLSGVTIDDFQKNATALSGDGLTLNVTNCSVTGQGPTSVTAQNGIQIGFGAGGTVTNCTVTGVGYTGESWTATAMLFYNASSVNLSGGSISGSQTSVMYQETQGAIDGITITSTTITGTAISIPDYGSLKTAAENTALKSASPFEEENKNGTGLKGGPTNVTIDNVVLTGVLEPGSYGIAAWAIGDDVNVTITKSTIQDWGIGVVAKDSVGSVTVVADSNTISGNDFGVWTNTASVQNFENNNWGTSDGPEDSTGTAEAYIGQCYAVDSMKNTVAELFPAEGLGNGVSDNVDYCPWIPWSCCVVRGDVDHGGDINVVDLIYLVDYIFFGGPPPPCFEEGDVDGVTAINVADLTYLVEYIFFAGPPPPPC